MRLPWMTGKAFMVEEEWLEEKEVKVKNEDGRLWGWSEKKRARAGLVGEERF